MYLLRLFVLCMLPDITKLPCFDVVVPGDCLWMWKSYHEQYRGEMSASLIGGDCTAKNKAAADEIYKKYKEV